MKKNLFSIIILALVIVNLILTAILMFSVVPSANKTNRLITKITSILDLELVSQKEEDGEDSISIDQIATYDIADKMTVNLKQGTDGETHYAVFQVTLSMDTENDGYKEYGETISERESLIKSEIINAISSYTYDEMQENSQVLNAAILERLQDMYDSDFIVSVSFSDLVFQ